MNPGSCNPCQVAKARQYRAVCTTVGTGSNVPSGPPQIEGLNPLRYVLSPRGVSVSGSGDFRRLPIVSIVVAFFG